MRWPKVIVFQKLTSPSLSPHLVDCGVPTDAIFLDKCLLLLAQKIIIQLCQPSIITLIVFKYQTYFYPIFIAILQVSILQNTYINQVWRIKTKPIKNQKR